MAQSWPWGSQIAVLKNLVSAQCGVSFSPKFLKIGGRGGVRKNECLEELKSLGYRYLPGRDTMFLFKRDFAKQNMVCVCRQNMFQNILSGLLVWLGGLAKFFSAWGDIEFMFRWIWNLPAMGTSYASPMKERVRSAFSVFFFRALLEVTQIDLLQRPRHVISHTSINYHETASSAKVMQLLILALDYCRIKPGQNYFVS